MFLWMTRGWNSLTKRRRKIKLPSRKDSDQAEPMKTIATDNLWAVITWHKWTAISITVSFAVICLNVIEYPISGELGKNSVQTANILGALQLAIKTHELCIVASLVCIAKQWIQSSFMDMNRGMVLGLVGAEGMLGQPSFVVSKEFYAAISYGLSGLWSRQGGTPKQRQIFTLSLFLFLACIISALSGPASGALMIPRVDWFFEKDLTVPIFPSSLHFPNLLIDPRYGYGTSQTLEFFDPFKNFFFDTVNEALGYWGNYEVRQDINTGDTSAVQEGRDSHGDTTGRVVTNTSTTWNRAIGGDWTGSSTATTAMRQFDIDISHALANRTHESLRVGDNQIQRSKWKGVKYETYGTAVQVRTECHYGAKQECGSENSTDWCYTRSRRDSTLQSSRNLLLLWREYQFNRGWSVYLTEGPRSETIPNFAASLEFVIRGTESPAEKSTVVPPLWIVVCSASARIGSTTISASDIMVDHEYSPYADYQILANGTKESSGPLLYHEHWIDAMSAPIEVDDEFEPLTFTGNVSFGPRNPNIVTQSSILRKVGSLVTDRFASTHYRDYGLVQDIEAAEIELPLAGIMSALISFLSLTDSQYALPAGVRMADTFLPRQLFYDNQTEMRFPVYNLGYGFRLSTRTGILGIAVLLCHVVIALAGSFWQVFRWRKVITAWSTVPDYLALGVGSSTGQPGFKNTCAGVSGKQTLQSIVTIENSIQQHLGVEVTEVETTLNTVAARSTSGNTHLVSLYRLVWRPEKQDKTGVSRAVDNWISLEYGRYSLW